MRIAVGCDHRGLELKQFIIKLVTEMGHVGEDFGCYSTASVDYPDIAKKVADSMVLQNTVLSLSNTLSSTYTALAVPNVNGRCQAASPLTVPPTARTRAL